MSKNVIKGRYLDLRSVLMELVEDRWILQADANFIMGATRTREQSGLHPISYIGKQNLHHVKTHVVLDELALSKWLAGKSNLDIFHIDPMKVPVAQTSELMSFVFAKFCMLWMLIQRMYIVKMLKKLLC